MVSQHPDHANKPDWLASPFIRTQDEIYEAYHAFFDIGASEYKWDWEGKFVDEAVVERLLSEYYEKFKEMPLGKEKFLTFRLPNPKVETEFRLGRAFMGIIGSAGLAQKAGLVPPLFEVILPMTETSKEMIDIQDAYQEMANLKHPLLKIDTSSIQRIELIPLFEQVDVIMNSDRVVEEYIEYYEKKFGEKPEYIRPYVARSDPALNSGLVPTVLAIRIALSRYTRLSVPSYPIIGSASLPFRGGLRPDTVEQFANEYKGVRTALIQSAFRYDFPMDTVRAGVQKMETLFPRNTAVDVSAKDEMVIRRIIPLFEAAYRPVIESIADTINLVAGALPKRRERVQHTGLFGYSRGVGSVKLPRAIGFTAALYSVGAPPEIIGTGRILKQLHDTDPEGYAVVLKYYLNIENDMLRAMKYVNKDALKALAKVNDTWNLVLEDADAIEALFGISTESETDDHKNHDRITSSIVTGIHSDSFDHTLLEQSAKLRRSLG